MTILNYFLLKEQTIHLYDLFDYFASVKTVTD